MVEDLGYRVPRISSLLERELMRNRLTSDQITVQIVPTKPLDRRKGLDTQLL